MYLYHVRALAQYLLLVFTAAPFVFLICVFISEKSVEVFLLQFLSMLNADPYNAKLLSGKVRSVHSLIDSLGLLFLNFISEACTILPNFNFRLIDFQLVDFDFDIIHNFSKHWGYF